jgi:predicted HTH transcriptional regulator
MQLKFFQIPASGELAEEELNKFLRSHRVLRIERGHLPLDWTVARLTEKHSSKPFNPDIANAFFRAGEIESWGRGVERILTACQEANCPAPEIDYTPGDFWFKFPFRSDYVAATTPEPNSIKTP